MDLNNEEATALREIIKARNLEVSKLMFEILELKALLSSAVGAYTEVLKHGGAGLAANRYTNPLIAKVEDKLESLR